MFFIWAWVWLFILFISRIYFETQTCCTMIVTSTQQHNSNNNHRKIHTFIIVLFIHKPTWDVNESFKRKIFYRQIERWSYSYGEQMDKMDKIMKWMQKEIYYKCQRLMFSIQQKTTVYKTYIHTYMHSTLIWLDRFRLFGLFSSYTKIHKHIIPFKGYNITPIHNNSLL